MVNQSCPECADQRSSAAAFCASCACLVSTVKTSEFSNVRTHRPAGDMGAVPGAVFILLACAGITSIVSQRLSSNDDPKQPAHAPVSGARIAGAPKNGALGVTRAKPRTTVEALSEAELALTRTQQRYDSFASQTTAILDLPATEANLAQLARMLGEGRHIEDELRRRKLEVANLKKNL